jgi:hypothetical protein
MERDNIVDINLSFALRSRPKSGTADYKEYEPCTNQPCRADAAVSILICAAEHGAGGAQKRANSKTIPSFSKCFQGNWAPFPQKKPPKSTLNPCYSLAQQAQKTPLNRNKSTL